MGMIEANETPEVAARREASEELGIVVSGPLEPLGTLRQAGGKILTVFALEQEIDRKRGV